MEMQSFGVGAVLAAGLMMLGLAGGSFAVAADVTPMADDACVTQCDEEADKCMDEAAGDESKEKACDERYDKCLDKCG
jgi:hypothetical protein